MGSSDRRDTLGEILSWGLILQGVVVRSAAARLHSAWLANEQTSQFLGADTILEVGWCFRSTRVARVIESRSNAPRRLSTLSDADNQPTPSRESHVRDLWSSLDNRLCKLLVPVQIGLCYLHLGKFLTCSEARQL